MNESDDVAARSKWLQEAKFERILSSDSSHKSLFALVRHSSGEKGIILLNKSAFVEDGDYVQKLCDSAKLDLVSMNDVYRNCNLFVPSELNVINLQLIYPATDKHVLKYTSEEKYVIEETADDFQNITAEYICKYQLNLTWVYNILDGKAETDRVIFNDPDPHNGFLLASDIKWDGKTIENLYALAIIRRKNVRSIRDLTAEDIPLLENIRDKSLEAIEKEFGLHRRQLRMYFHYQPSFFHLHVHFVNLKFDAPGSIVLSAISLDDVINNLRLVANYYQKATLTFTRKKSDDLLRMFVDAGRLKL